jgi:hypothetical protein
MEDEFYTINEYIAHKSCEFDGKYFSNAKYGYNVDDFAVLEKRCNLINKITENINLPIGSKFCTRNLDNRGHVYLSRYNIIEHWSGYKYHKMFKSYEEFYDFMCVNYPHLIKSHDIKIALKD